MEIKIESLVKAAQGVLKYADDKNHTVAAAVMTAENEIITGLNFYHFTGGPCAEIVALATAVSAGKKDFQAIIAVGNNDRGVLSPCGRCRQILFDYYPKIKVILTESNNLVIKTTDELLSYAYDWNAEQAT